MDIMTTLFDQDYITKLYGMDQREEGKKEGEREVAKSLKDAGMSVDFIAKHTGLSLEEIQKLN